MDKSDNQNAPRSSRGKVAHGFERTPSTEIAICGIAMFAIALIILLVVFLDSKTIAVSVAIIVVVICVATVALTISNPDSVRARQTDNMLRLSGDMVDLMASTGMTPEVAQAICALLLPNTAAIAVAITNTTNILGYVGYREAENPQGSKIRTQATHDAIKDGEIRIIHSAEEIGLPKKERHHSIIRGAIIVPLRLGRQIRGTLKFYYKSPRKITETQRSIAEGFGNLLSIQLAATELEKQRELATKMELKMLQNQINPHFLFNTINTIASLIRTDPSKAYVLLREFAVFYRATLENAEELIPLARELQQTMRYFSFEVARFGTDRLGMEVRVQGFGTHAGDIPAGAALVEPGSAAGAALAVPESATNEAPDATNEAPDAANEAPDAANRAKEDTSAESVAGNAVKSESAPDGAFNGAIDFQHTEGLQNGEVASEHQPVECNQNADAINVADMEVPPFLLQPLVENAIKHAMPATGKLVVSIRSDIDHDDVLVHVKDNGLGMTEEAKQSIMHPESSTGLGIAVKNVHDRMHGFFGEYAEMLVESELGKGTTVTLRFPGMADALRSE